MKNKTRVREYLENGMDLDALIEGYDLNEAESYSQSMINPNTVKGKDVDKDEKEEASKTKKKEYASSNGKANEGDLVGANSYGTTYGDEGENSYGTEDDKLAVAKADPYATENPDGVNIGEAYGFSGDETPTTGGNFGDNINRSFKIKRILKNDLKALDTRTMPNGMDFFISFKDGGEVTVCMRGGKLQEVVMEYNSPTADMFKANFFDESLIELILVDGTRSGIL